MTISTTRFVVIGLLFLGTLGFGVWLSNVGKPYQAALFNIHKLIALGAVIVTTVTVFQVRASVDIQALTLGIIVITLLLFAALFVSGALLSIGRQDAAVVLIIHRAAPLLAVIFTTLSLYLLTHGKA